MKKKRRVRRYHHVSLERQATGSYLDFVELPAPMTTKQITRFVKIKLAGWTVCDLHYASTGHNAEFEGN